MLGVTAKVVAVHDAVHDHVKDAVHKIVDAKVEFVEDVQSMGKGEGGFAEDHEYFGELANI
jgi:hypothetical protein